MIDYNEFIKLKDNFMQKSLSKYPFLEYLAPKKKLIIILFKIILKICWESIIKNKKPPVKATMKPNRRSRNFDA